MSASTDTSPPSRAVWAPAGLMLAATLLVGLAAGLWPGAIYPTQSPAAKAALPTLRTLAVSQVVFVLLIWPLTLMRAAKGAAPRWARRAARIAVTIAAYLLVSMPFYVAAAWLGDAGPVDVARTVLYVACLAPLAWAAGACMARGGGASSWVLLLMLVLVAGCPAAYYVAREFLSGAGDPAWLWRLGPATGAWDVAAGRGSSIIPTHLWPLGLYVAAAVAVAIVGMLDMRARR